MQRGYLQRLQGVLAKGAGSHFGGSQDHRRDLLRLPEKDPRHRAHLSVVVTRGNALTS